MPWPADSTDQKVLHYIVEVAAVEVISTTPKYAEVLARLLQQRREGLSELCAYIEFTSRIVWQAYHLGTAAFKIARSEFD